MKLYRETIGTELIYTYDGVEIEEVDRHIEELSKEGFEIVPKEVLPSMLRKPNMIVYRKTERNYSGKRTV